MTTWRPTALVSLLLLPAGLTAQSYDDLMMVRARPERFASVLQVRAGALGSLADDEDTQVGLENEIGWDGHLYFRTGGVGGREAELKVYAGRDGAYLSVLEGTLLGGETQTRIELNARYFPFYREGFYRSGDFIPTGRYEGDDWGAAVLFAREVQEGLRMEVGPFFRSYSFDRNDATAVNYLEPDDFTAYGARLYLEHNILELDRLTGRPRVGFILTLAGEYEKNDSDRRFGTQSIYESTLPSGVWRGRGHLEWYFPVAQSATWEVRVDGQITDDKDRVHNFDAQKPPGHLWVDGEIRLRLDLGNAIALTPFAKGQLVRLPDEAGVGTDQETFFGGGLDAVVDFGDMLSLIGHYSYLGNESRPPVSTSDDTFGEHRFFVGIEARFGAQRQ